MSVKLHNETSNCQFEMHFKKYLNLLQIRINNTVFENNSKMSHFAKLRARSYVKKDIKCSKSSPTFSPKIETAKYKNRESENI